MAEAAEALTIEQAALELVEAPNAVPEEYRPGQLESDTPAAPKLRGALSFEEGAALLDDEEPRGRSAGRPVVTYNGRGLTHQQLLQGFNEAVNLYAVLGDLQARYEDITQAGRNLHVGATAIAELLATMFPPPAASLAQTDPLQWQQAQVLYETVHSAAIQVTQHAHAIAEQNAEWAKAQAPKINFEVELRNLKDAFPKAGDPEWGKWFINRVTKAAEACGYHASELETVMDHRALRVLDLAATALERRQSGKRDGAKPSSQPVVSASRPGPRLVAEGGSLTKEEAMLLDFD